MTAHYEDALVTVLRRRAALRVTIEELKDRARPAQLADDALRLLDPHLTFLERLKARIGSNKLLSLAVLAGAGWLAGVPRHLTGDEPAARKASTATLRAKPKEKNNDSGQQQRNQRPGLGRHSHQDARPQGLAQAQPGLGPGGEAQQGPGIGPRQPHGEPRRRRTERLAQPRKP